MWVPPHAGENRSHAFTATAAWVHAVSNTGHAGSWDGVKDMQQPDLTDSRAEHLLECTWRPQRAAQARDAAAEFLADLRPTPPASTVQDLALLVSELVTNALRHAGGVSAMSLRADRRSIQVIVADPSPAHPQDHTPDLAGQTGGFGWPMIQRMAPSVRVEPQAGGGKAITATLPR